MVDAECKLLNPGVARQERFVVRTRHQTMLAVAEGLTPVLDQRRTTARRSALRYGDPETERS
jgi:hypothetical protein